MSAATAVSVVLLVLAAGRSALDRRWRPLSVPRSLLVVTGPVAGVAVYGALVDVQLVTGVLLAASGLGVVVGFEAGRHIPVRVAGRGGLVRGAARPAVPPLLALAGLTVAGDVGTLDQVAVALAVAWLACGVAVGAVMTLAVRSRRGRTSLQAPATSAGATSTPPLGPLPPT